MVFYLSDSHSHVLKHNHTQCIQYDTAVYHSTYFPYSQLITIEKCIITWATSYQLLILLSMILYIKTFSNLA